MKTRIISTETPGFYKLQCKRFWLSRWKTITVAPFYNCRLMEKQINQK